MRTTMPFMLQNPFPKNIDWLTVIIIAALTGGMILFLLSVRMISSL